MISIDNVGALVDVASYMDSVPYDVTPRKLYSAEELYKGYSPDDDSSFSTCYDTLTYNHYVKTGKHGTDAHESLSRALHDHGINMALNDFFKEHDHRKCVGIMGGHSMSRTDPMFKKVVLLCKRLTEAGFVMLSGGGPGAMEATHLGAWMAGRPLSDVEGALEILSEAPSYKDEKWLKVAFKVREKYPHEGDYASLGIPTWLYGHEPSTPFATHIAKFFENSIREDSILTLAFGGIVYTPGSAGTVQEIFQDAVQNHYLSFGFASPMIFMGKEYWTREMPIYPLLMDLVARGKYVNLPLTLTDDPRDILEILKDFSQGGSVAEP